MQAADSKAYFARRAAEERARAEQCGDRRAAQSHRELARCYEEQANGGGAAAEDEPRTILPREFRILP